MSTLPRFVVLFAGLGFALPAAADDLDCGLSSLRSTSLVQCANPHDSPGPYAPPPLSFLIEQDAHGVTAVLDDGTTVDVDVESNGSVVFAVNGMPGDVADVEDVLDAHLTADEQAAVSAALTPAILTVATDELVDILGE
jgi:hypothetical protein